jgi:hypothetical protein
MAAKKGRVTAKDTGKKRRPKCSSLLKALIEAFTEVCLRQIAPTGPTLGMATLEELLGKKSPQEIKPTGLITRGDIEFLQGFIGKLVGVALGNPHVKEAAKSFTADQEGLNLQQADDLKRRIMGVLTDDHLQNFVRSHQRVVRQLVRKFHITIAAEKILEAAWDPRCSDQWMKIKGLLEFYNVEEDLKYLKWVNKHYNGMLTVLLESPHMDTKAEAVKIGILLGVLNALKTHYEKLSRWKAREGFTQPSGDPKRHRLWTEIIVRVVDAVLPSCPRIRGEWGNEAIRKRSFEFTSELLNKCYPPGGWRWENVRARWLRAKGLA